MWWASISYKPMKFRLPNENENRFPMTQYHKAEQNTVVMKRDDNIYLYVYYIFTNVGR